jgi:hypothetical protein
MPMYNYFKGIIYNLTAMSNKNQIVYTMSYVQNAKTHGLE